MSNNNNLLVKDIMLPIDRFPIVEDKLILKETLEEMNKYRLGIACIIDKNSNLVGVFTDGDFRRLLLKYQKPLSRLFLEDTINVARKNFIAVNSNEKIIDSFDLMEKKEIWDLPVIDNESNLLGLLHLHPVVKVLT